ncbi:hypothetical protein BDA99DRAFT_163777 [Phascolomyces articulosus]|uniref:Uncharacterized protein n=1 Tax=Phascolomyces articulosus TaxID=60185 RepID=A0AAD5JTX5_9FUNG|nr:hypothetical protein BDA99DRAFT_163777 [Phascolomyces articulosus]
MDNSQTYVGWTSLEIGHLTPQYDQNFVLYANPNEKASGLNCKIRVFDIAQSDVRDYLSQGGMCRVIVRGMMRTAPIPEQGWIPSSTRYLQVTWIMQEQGPEFLGEQVIVGASDSSSQPQGGGGAMTTAATGGGVSISSTSTTGQPLMSQLQQQHSSQQQPFQSSQQHQPNHRVAHTPMGHVRIVDDEEEDITEDEPRSEENEDDSDPDYSSIDAEEEEQARLDEVDYDEDSSMGESDEVSGEDIEKLMVEAKEPLDLEYAKKREAEEQLQNGNNKKQKQHTINNSHPTSTTAPTTPTTTKTL